MALKEHEAHRTWLEMDECMVICSYCKHHVIQLSSETDDMKHDYKRPHYFQRKLRRRRIIRNIEAGLGALGLFACIYLLWLLFAAFVPG